MAIRTGRAQKIITPFWNRMPRFFLYPLTPPGLYVLFGLAVLNALVVDMLLSGRVVPALVLGLVSALFSIKYGYDVLERTAHGEMLPPRLTANMLLDRYELPFKQLAVFILLGLMAFGFGMIWPPLAIIVGVVTFVLLPAIFMTLALERSVFAAINPGTLFGIAFRVGWPYLAVFGLVLLLNGGSGTVMALFGDTLPAPAQGFLSGFSQNLFFFAMMHLMGYLLYQYHDRLGFSPDSLAADDDGWGEVMAPVQEAIEAENHVLAAQRLQSLIRDYPDSALDLRQHRHQLLKLADAGDMLVDNAGHLLAGLIDANRMREATEVFIDITDVDPELRPGREGDFEPLLHLLVQRGEYRRAVRMANGFHKSFPGSESVPPLYLEVARVFSDYLDQPARARQIADFLGKTWPDHPASNRARALRDAVTN